MLAFHFSNKQLTFKFFHSQEVTVKIFVKILDWKVTLLKVLNLNIDKQNLLIFPRIEKDAVRN